VELTRGFFQFERMDEDLANAIRVLTQAGAVICTNQPHYSIGNAARQLDVSKGWMREHLQEFPNAWRLPGAGESGEWRFPARDIEALARRRRQQPAVQEVAA
jgi:hypothetical protein